GGSVAREHFHSSLLREKESFRYGNCSEQLAHSRPTPASAAGAESYPAPVSDTRRPGRAVRARKVFPAGKRRLLHRVFHLGRLRLYPALLSAAGLSADD